MDTHVLRVHFTNGTSALSGMIDGDAPDLVDASFAADVNRGWDLGRNTVLPDGRIIEEISAEPFPQGAAKAA